MVDSRFAILMALFLPNKELFTNFVMFNHAWKQRTKKTSEIIFRVTQNRTCELPQFLCYFDEYAII